VARLVWEGLTYPDIAARLVCSRRTVETHVAHIFRKLGVPNRHQLLKAAESRFGGTSGVSGGDETH
jgi:DNA-binding NarL/FixJ family response regulator